MTVPDAIKGGTAPLTQNFAQIKATPNIYIGQQVRLGGQVVSVKNGADDSSLEVVSYPLNDSARPQFGRASEGRFLIHVKKFLEPTEYSGAYVTVLGTLQGTERGDVDKAPYLFPVVNAMGLQRWHLTQEVIYPGGGIMWSGPLDSYYYPYYPYFSPHGSVWGYGPPRVHTILTE